MTKPKNKPLQAPEMVQCLRRESWEPVALSSLMPGDIVHLQHKTVIVAKPPYKNDQGNTVIPGDIPTPKIIIAIGEPIRRDMDDVWMAADYCGSGIHDFGDGTMMIIEMDYGPDYVYSPRLPVADLQAFCQEHMEQYRIFYDDYSLAIENGELIPMTPFWKKDNNASINAGELDN